MIRNWFTCGCRIASVTSMSESAEKKEPFVERAELSIATLMVESEKIVMSGSALFGFTVGSEMGVPSPVGD